MAENKNLLSKESVRKITAKYKRTWEIAYYCAVLDVPEARNTRIEFLPDGNSSFHDPIGKRIVIGLRMAVLMWQITAAELLQAAVRMLRTHEIGHLRYTASEPYAWGIGRGAELIIEGISKRLEKKPRKFRKDADYAYFVEEVLPKEYDIYLNITMIRKKVRFIANALEDGRIERILANHYTGFEEIRRLFRGMTWKNDVVPVSREEVENPKSKLMLVLDEILSLSTTQLDMNGYQAEFAGTETAEEIKKLHPYIFAGITAATTREMVMKGLLPICESVAGTFLDACQVSKGQRDGMEWLEKIFRDLIIASVDEMDETNTGISERDAEEDDSEFNPSFPLSDLEVTLPDDVYDKLMDKLKDKGASDDGLHVKREHPLPDAEMDEDEESSGFGGPSDSDVDSCDSEPDSEPNSGNEASAAGQNAEDEELTTNQDRQTSNEDGCHEGISDDMSPAASQGNEETDEADDVNHGDAVSQDQSGQTPQTGEQKGKTSSGNDTTSAEDVLSEVERAMEEAAKNVIAEAREAENSVNAKSHADTRARMKQEIPSPAIPLTNSDVRDICPRDFIEVFRKYKLDERLPVDLEAKGRTAHRKYELFARNRKKPVSRFRKDGKIDARNLYRLGMNKTDVFMKDGKVKGFDGCAYILIDNSGSMHGEKRLAACKAAAVQEEAFRGLFPFKIVAFDETSKIIHEVVKDWNEQQMYNCCWNFSCHGRYGSGNADEHDIRIATKELLSRSEHKKLLIVLSDGAPDDCEDTKRAIQEARKKGITVFGIYFEEGEIDEHYSRFFVEMYEKDYVLCETSEIESNLSKLMERFFKS